MVFAFAWVLKYITNMGDEADLVVALNEQVLYNRIENAPSEKEPLFFWRTSGPKIRSRRFVKIMRKQ